MSIVTLTMNPAIDLSTSVDTVAPSRKLRGSEARRDPGGGGINVARVMKRLGGTVTAIYPVGGATGRLLQQLVDAEGIPGIVHEVAEETRIDFTVDERTTHKQYRFVLPGPHLRETEWRALLDALATLADRPDFVVASGSLPPGVPGDFYARVAGIAKRLGAKFVLDSSGPALEAALAEGVYLFKPNLRELRELVRAPLADEAAMLEACRRLVRAGRAEVVALTLGHSGALLVTRERALRADPLPVEVVSTVGAGDSFLGALIWKLDAGASLEDAFRVGMAAGAAALLSPGTELCRREDVERLAPAVKVRTL